MSKYTNYRFGQEALMPQGQPFRVAIEGIDREFELVHRIDDAGQIRMSLDVASDDRLAADRSSRVTMSDQQRRRHVDDDEGDFDPVTGILRDGRRIRVPLPMMDSNLRGRGTKDDPIIITTGLNLGKHFHPDGTPRRRGGSSRKTRQTDATITETDDHRPHFVDSYRSASEAARAEGIREMCDAWRGPQVASPPAAADAAPPQGVSPTEWARHQMIQEMTDAWRGPVRDADPLSQSTGASTRATASVPPTGAYCPAGFGAKPGDPCTFEGSPVGRLVERDGWLFCEFTPLGPTRGDSMSAADGEALKAAAYNEMVADLTSAWKG
jgi:hypothetical protein